VLSAGFQKIAQASSYANNMEPAVSAGTRLVQRPCICSSNVQHHLGRPLPLATHWPVRDPRPSAAEHAVANNVQLVSGFSSSASNRRASLRVSAQRDRDGYADYDEDFADGGGSLVTGVFGSVLGALNGITDVIADALPTPLPRPVVGVAVKGGLALIVLGFAKSLLSFVTTIGTIVLGLYIASKVFGDRE